MSRYLNQIEEHSISVNIYLQMIINPTSLIRLSAFPKKIRNEAEAEGIRRGLRKRLPIRTASIVILAHFFHRRFNLHLFQHARLKMSPT
jgi:hypothetical protein